MLNSSEVSGDGEFKLIEKYSISELTEVEILENLAEKEIIYYLVEPGLSAEEEKLFHSVRSDLETILPEILIGRTRDARTLEKEILEYSWRQYNSSDKSLRERFDYYIRREYFGYGIIDAVMHDQNVEDISCDGPGIPIFVYHSRYDVLKTNIVFRGPETLSSFLVRLAQKCSKSISIRSPILDGTTCEGHRVQGTFEREVTTLGSSFTIRLFRKKVFTPSNILESEMADANILAYLWLAVEHLESGMIAGPPGAGKTSFLNAMMQFAPENTKILSIEETRELNIEHSNWISTATREIAPELTSLGTQSLSMFDLVKAAMRQRPTYIVVGEVRGEETYSLFQAMSTGHTTYSEKRCYKLITII
jgi:flagellar protein FlaI